MDELDDIRRRLRISNLEARRELLEIERTAISREITSPLTNLDRREQLSERRDQLAMQSAEITEELKMRES